MKPRLQVLSVLFLFMAVLQISAVVALPPSDLPVHEAEVLIFLLPESHTVREQGHKIEWHQGSGSDALHFYYFSVHNATRQNPDGSVLIGHYAVNKRTAHVWRTDAEGLVESPELAGVQSILRRAHGITPDILRKFGTRKPGFE